MHLSFKENVHTHKKVDRIWHLHRSPAAHARLLGMMPAVPPDAEARREAPTCSIAIFTKHVGNHQKRTRGQPQANNALATASEELRHVWAIATSEERREELVRGQPPAKNVWATARGERVDMQLNHHGKAPETMVTPTEARLLILIKARGRRWSGKKSKNVTSNQIISPCTSWPAGRHTVVQRQERGQTPGRSP